jgi:hypothetical protein
MAIPQDYKSCGAARVTNPAVQAARVTNPAVLIRFPKNYSFEFSSIRRIHCNQLISNLIIPINQKPHC